MLYLAESTIKAAQQFGDFPIVKSKMTNIVLGKSTRIVAPNTMFERMQEEIHRLSESIIRFD